MNRRQFLAGFLSGSLLGTAGCTSDTVGGTARTPTPTPGPVTPEPIRRGNVTLPVPSEEIYTALARDQIPAIVEPRFAPDWSDVVHPETGESATLDDSAAVIGVEREGTARAYPLAILNWHEVVNDTLGGPIMVTYCVLCGSAVVTERRVDGRPTIFGVSGKLWRSDLVMYDRLTESLWSQLLATAIRGPRTGDTLRILPSSLTTWGEWRADNPATEVLLPPPASNTVNGPDDTYDYFEPKYGYGEEAQLIGYDTDDRLHPKTLVLGVTHDGIAKAYPFQKVREAGGVLNDHVGDRPVVIATTVGGSLVGFDRRIDGTARQFAPDGEDHMVAADSRWARNSGTAVEGPYAGHRLTPVTDIPAMFWFGWERFQPDSIVYGFDRDRTPTP